MCALSHVQDCVAGALLAIAAPVPDALRGARRQRAARRLDIYRRNIAARLIDQLATTFPVTRQMIGEESFAAMTRAYIVKFPPISPVLLAYGASLPRFIQSLGAVPSIEYLADVAALESARCGAFHAADAAPVSATRLTQAKSGFGVTLQLHPSV